MSLTANSPENDAMQHVSTAPIMNDCESLNDIPRRLMRVKVLYTFDIQNNSNCLARLPNALNIPVVSLDETTEVGVIALKNCIQAIASASPELVAKLDHDFTVYAYDYSEYETPLVGQGMLSWILASASASPNAPADQSQTMVTGRVCKNILGLFSNGIKETLEVKLKLVPVPTCLQREYVENMERYHSLSKLVPEGLDYSQWAGFLKANPAIEQLACPTPEDISQSYQQFPFGGVDSIHDMLTPMPREDSFQPDMYSEQFGMSFHTQDTRASSPALSTNSYNPYFANHDSRPASRASFHSESMAQSQSHHHTRMPSEGRHQQEEGPSKKRVRLTQAKRPKKTVLGANNDSLRVTASTAASVRLHRPVATNPATALASIEQVPRAPTPRPSHSIAHPQGLRPPAPSLLRHASIDDARPYITPYEPGVFSDAAVESADDERGSPDETPTYMPSSPPLMPHRLPSSAPSSPGLPTLPYPADSGFVSDVAQGRDEDEVENRNKAWEGSDLPTVSDVRARPKLDKSNFPWKEVNPGPVELLPKSYIPKPKQYPRPAPAAPVTNNTDNKDETVQRTSTDEGQIPIIRGANDQIKETREGLAEALQASKSDVANFGPTNEGEHTQHRSTTMPPWEADPESQRRQHQYVDRYQQFNTHHVPQYTTAVPAHSRSTTPNPPPKRSKASKPRGLPRSQTWSVGPMSDAAGPLDGNPLQPRSGSGAKRRQNIANKLNVALDKGEMPDFCSNCGEIETPTWRKAYTRTEDGEATDVTLSTVGNGIVGFEIMVPAEGSEDGPKFRIFKNILDQEEKEGKTYKALVLCNPCGLWLNKKGAMRPIGVWGKKNNNGEKPKRKRKPAPPGSRKRAKGNDNDLKSDAIVPHSEPFHGAHGGSIDTRTLQPMDDATAQAALQRAIQSSPVGFGGSQPSPIDVDPDLTPRPTRRLLFPSPRKVGEAKSLESGQLDGSQSSVSPRSKPMPSIGEVEVDKENLPPIDDEGEDDDLAHLFEDSAFAHKTPPSKGAPFQDLLKTPTPGSRRRVPLTPKRGTSDTSLKIPSHNILTTPRSQRAATIAPETPFTRQLNALMSDCPLSSPSQAIDFSAFPTFNTPGRVNSSNQFCDFMNDDFMSSDMPIPSSPPAGLGFSLYEDPETATVGLWSGASIFNSDPVQMNDDQAHGDVKGSASGAMENKGHETMLKINGLSVDFAAMIEEVVANSKPENTNAISVANKDVNVNATKVEATVETHDAISATVEEKAGEAVETETLEQETKVVVPKVVDSTEVPA